MPVHNITNIHVLYSIDSAKLQLGVKPELRLSENQAPVIFKQSVCVNINNIRAQFRKQQ
jgi:hypothetical protein